MGAIAWPQQLGLVCFPVTSEEHIPFSPPSVQVTAHTKVTSSCKEFVPALVTVSPLF